MPIARMNGVSHTENAKVGNGGPYFFSHHSCNSFCCAFCGSTSVSNSSVPSAASAPATSTNDLASE